MGTRLSLVILAVGDVASAARFYREAFGWPQQVDEAVYAEFAFPDGQRLGLYDRAARPPPPVLSSPSDAPAGHHGCFNTAMMPDGASPCDHSP